MSNIDHLDEFTQFCLRSNHFKGILSTIAFGDGPTLYNIGGKLMELTDAIEWFNENRDTILALDSGTHEISAEFLGMIKQFNKLVERFKEEINRQLVYMVSNPLVDKMKWTFDIKADFCGKEIRSTMSNV